MVQFDALAPLPVTRIALAVEAGNEQNSVGFNLVEQAIRKAPHGGASAALMNNRKPKGRFSDDLYAVLDRLNEAL